MADPIEQDTLLGAAKYGPGAKDGAFIPRQIKRPDESPLPPNDGKPSFNADGATRRIWHFEHKLPTGRDATGTANEITQLSCRTHASDYQPMVVCDSVRWEDVLVTLVAGSKPVPLTLTSKYLLTQRFLEDGEISNDIADCVQADPGELWRRLPQKIDVAFELMFGFRFNKAKTAYEPMSPESVTPAELKSMSLLGQTSKSEAEQAGTLPASTGVTNVYRFKANDIIVTISLVCCKQSWHFTPNLPQVPWSDMLSKGPSPLGVARFFPLTYVRPMFQVHKVESRTRLARPAMAHGHQHPSPELLKHIPLSADSLIGGYTTSRPPVKGTDSAMLSSYAASFYADHNWPLSDLGAMSQGADAALGAARAVAPMWNLTFSHYHTNPATARDYLVVLPRSVNGKTVRLKQTHADPQGDWQMRFMPLPTFLPDKAPLQPNCDVTRIIRKAAKYEGDTSDVYKLPGQGLFDNVHLAPMMADPYANAAAIARGFGAISMAPFCVHDCLHTHWRWLPDPTTVGPISWVAAHTVSSEAVGQWNYGWSQDGKPYSQAGATMVPLNQQVSVRLESAGGSLTPNAFTYTAEAFEPKVDQPSIFFHHGSAYSALVAEASNFIAALNQPDVEASLDPGVVRQSSSSQRGVYSSWKTTVPAYVSWARFYWELRYDFVGGRVRERVQVPDWAMLQELPDLTAIHQTTSISPAIPDPGTGQQTAPHRADAIPCAPLDAVPQK